MPCHPDFGRFSRCDYQITHTDFHSDLKLVPETLWSEGEVLFHVYLIELFVVEDYH